MSNSEIFRKSMKVEELNDQQKVRIYEKFRGEQEEQFEQYMNYINELLCILKDYRIVSDFTKFTARVKSTESAIKNDSEKALDDVFGMEVDFATPGEKAFVSEIIKGTLKQTKEKVHIKRNGYIAYHSSGYPDAQSNIVDILEKILNEPMDDKRQFEKYYSNLPAQKKENMNEEKEKKIRQYFNEEKESLKKYIEDIKGRMSDKYIKSLKEKLKNIEMSYKKNLELKRGEEFSIPIVEFQLKIIQVAIEANMGTASHGLYKGEDSSAMQKEYDEANGKIPLSKIPTMYSSDLERDADGKAIPPRILSSEATLGKLYPYLILKRDCGKNIKKGEEK